MSASDRPVCLTIAGLDPSGGAGIVADIKTFTAFGCFATAGISSVTFQNTTGVFGAVHQTAESVRRQVEPVLDDFEVAAIKTGMLPTREIIEETSRLIRSRNLANIVVDPVVRSTSGFDLIDDEALRSLIDVLFPAATVVTPNLPEAERICRFKIESEKDIAEAAEAMLAMGAASVLIKGGHAADGARTAVDHLFTEGRHVRFEAEFIQTTSTHGTGCTLSAAIAANLALGKNLEEAVGTAKEFVFEGIRTAKQFGKGHSPVNIPAIWPVE
ncbi:MAG: bifunctional hydroxymethylpyrimidine kinase/phosphomethylpyrimidine kinase [Acidobacteriota bacterium]